MKRTFRPKTFQPGQDLLSFMVLANHPTHDSTWLIVAEVRFISETHDETTFELLHSTHGFRAGDSESMAYFEKGELLTASREDFHARTHVIQEDSEWDAAWPPQFVKRETMRWGK